MTVLYSAFFDRAPDPGGFSGWSALLADGMSRADVLEGFIGSREFANLANTYGIRADSTTSAGSDAAVLQGDPGESDMLRAGAGNSILRDGDSVAETGAFNETELAGQVYRLYGATLGREPGGSGFQAWFNGINSEAITLDQAAGGFIASPEFDITYGALSDADFVQLLYRNVLGRTADPAGLAGWLDFLAGEDNTRADVVLGFSESAEYRNRTNAALDTFMRDGPPEWNDVLEGGAGDDTMNGGLGSDIFVFRNGEGGADVINGFEPWDQLQLSGFGLQDKSEAIALMRQDGSDVIFAQGDQQITFTDTPLAHMQRVRYNLS